MAAAAFKDVSFLGCFVSVLFILGDIAEELLSFLPLAACASGEGRGFLCTPPRAIAVHIQGHLAAELFAWSVQISLLLAGSHCKYPAQAPTWVKRRPA